MNHEDVDYPEYHYQGMGCGLEDRGITDRYEAMQYGWDEAIERCAREIVEPLLDKINSLEELSKTEAAYNAVIDYMLGKGYMESPLEFLRCWNEGNFEALREEWSDAPEEIYLADPLGSNPLYKGKK